MEWKRKDQMTVKEREEFKNQFIKSLIDDKERKWKCVEINNTKTLYMISDDGKLASLRMCRFMKAGKGTDGYLSTIIRHDNMKYNVSIHRLVAKAFIPNPGSLDEVNHIDGNKENNNVSNLEWVTHKENINHAIDIGLREKKPAKRLSIKKVHKICKMLEKCKSISKISKKIKVSKSAIRKIKNKKSWLSISIYYNI